MLILSTYHENGLFFSDPLPVFVRFSTVTHVWILHTQLLHYHLTSTAHHVRLTLNWVVILICLRLFVLSSSDCQHSHTVCRQHMQIGSRARHLIYCEDVA